MALNYRATVVRAHANRGRCEIFAVNDAACSTCDGKAGR